MIAEFLYSLPLWALGLLLFVACLSYVVLSIRVVHRFGWALDADEVGSATVLHAFVSLVYAVALALIVVSAQTDFSAVEDAVMTEASKLGDLYRNLDGLAEPDRGRLQEEVRRYIDLVLDKEWPATENGQSSEETARSIDSLARHVIQMHPSAPDAQVVQQALLQDVDDLLDARRKRIFLGHAGMHPITWLIIGAGAVITIGFAALFPMRRVGRQIAVMSMAAVMFSLMIFLVIAMDRPLRGDLSVRPGPIRMVKENIARLTQER